MLQGITEILREYKSSDSLEVTEETTFESLSLDSLDTVELVMMVEERFGVTIEMTKGIKTVSDLMVAIEKAN
jgi:acyl carrier protein